MLSRSKVIEHERDGSPIQQRLIWQSRNVLYEPNPVRAYFDTLTVLPWHRTRCHLDRWKVSFVTARQRLHRASSMSLTCLYNPEVPNVPISSFEVKKSRVGENAGRGLFTKVDIPTNTYIAAEASAHPIHFFPMTYELIFKLEDACDYNERMEALTYYIDGYGFTNQIFVSCAALVSPRLSLSFCPTLFSSVVSLLSLQGDLGVCVDSSIVTFENHGCRSTYNVGIWTEVNEFTAELDRPVETLNGKAFAGSDSIFDPVVDRHLVHTVDTSLKDIAAGDEILSNYLAYIGSEEFWAEDVTDLRNQCSGFETEGSVSEYERLDNAEKEKE